jgi:hypothetical protein
VNEKQWAPPDHAFSTEAVKQLNGAIPSLPTLCEAQVHLPNFQIEDLFSSCEGIAVLLRPVGGHGAKSLHGWHAELAHSLTATPCQNTLDFSGGIPFIFGVPASEGDSTAGTQFTTLVARLDLSTVPDIARLLLPVHRCTLLTVLHRSINDTLLHKYDQGLVRVEILSARVLTPSHKPVPTSVQKDVKAEQNATDAVAPDASTHDIIHIAACMSAASANLHQSHRAERSVNILVRPLSLPQIIFEAMRVSGFPLVLAKPGTATELVPLGPVFHI